MSLSDCGARVVHRTDGNVVVDVTLELRPVTPKIDIHLVWHYNYVAGIYMSSFDRPGYGFLSLYLTFSSQTVDTVVHTVRPLSGSRTRRYLHCNVIKVTSQEQSQCELIPFLDVSLRICGT